jgi:hypothetical protein
MLPFEQNPPSAPAHAARALKIVCTKPTSGKHIAKCRGAIGQTADRKNQRSYPFEGFEFHSIGRAMARHHTAHISCTKTVAKTEDSNNAAKHQIDAIVCHSTRATSSSHSSIQLSPSLGWSNLTLISPARERGISTTRYDTYDSFSASVPACVKKSTRKQPKNFMARHVA